MSFLADCTVTRLGRWLALAGCDVVCDARSARALLRDPEVLRSGRTVVGRCPSLAAETLAPGLFLAIQSERLAEQLAEVARTCPDAFRGSTTGGGGGLARAAGGALSRCSRCNAPLEGPLSHDALGADAAAVPERVRRWRTEYRRCPRCRRVYWEGTHSVRIRAVLARALSEASDRVAKAQTT